jgi:hypothetical protein
MYSLRAIAGSGIRVISDTTLAVSFEFPDTLPNGGERDMLNLIVSHPSDGVSLLPSALEIETDTSATDFHSRLDRLSGGETACGQGFSISLPECHLRDHQKYLLPRAHVVRSDVHVPDVGDIQH